jgi:anion-transporting  ArsA/GET3 family ATPase
VRLAGSDPLGTELSTGWGEMPANLRVVELEPRDVIDQVLSKIIPVPALSRLIAAHPAYDAVFGIAPGLKEMGVLHRLLEMAEQPGRIVVDGLATGHGAHFLEAPRKSARILAGKLQERARALDEALTDPARTSVLLVTTLEETPVRETVELASRLREGRFPVRAVIVNRFLPPLVASRGAAEALEALATRRTASLVGSEAGLSWRMVQEHARMALHLQAQAEEMEARLPELELLGLPVVRLPLEPAEQGRLRTLARGLEALP